MQIINDPLRREMYIYRVDDWCSDNLNEYRRVQHPGDLGDSSLPSSYMGSIPILCYYKTGICVPSAIENGLYAMGNRNGAMDFLK